jgi:hypothetical protein
VKNGKQHSSNGKLQENMQVTGKGAPYYIDTQLAISIFV